jgi:hypothetical protein
MALIPPGIALPHRAQAGRAIGLFLSRRSLLAPMPPPLTGLAETST